MTNARPHTMVGTGAVMPGGHGQRTASDRRSHPTHAEEAFVGALLHMQVPTAKEALDLIHEHDLADYLHEQIVTVARLLVADNIPPDPAAALVRARADGIVSGGAAIQAFAQRMADLYAAVPTPCSWRYYANGVIDEALRRRCVEMAARVAQAAETSSLDVLIDLLDAECRLVRRLHDRRLAAAGHLRAVS